VDVGAEAAGFYSLHYHQGLDADARQGARPLRAGGVRRVSLWGRSRRSCHASPTNSREGLLVVDREADAIVSLLAPHEHVPRLAGIAQPVLWLPGLHALGSRELDAALAARPRGWIITPMRSGEALDRQLVRAREWLRQQGLAGVPLDVGASTLQAATVLGEGLVHVDFAFTPEYLLEAARARPGERRALEPVSAPGDRPGPAHRLQGQLGGRIARRARRLAVAAEPALKAAQAQPAAPDVTTAAACMCRGMPGRCTSPRSTASRASSTAELRCSFRIRLARCFSTVLALRLR
jgi:hypothetical protein